MKNKILLILFLLPVCLAAQIPHRSGYTDWLTNHSSQQFSKENKVPEKLRDITTYLLKATRRDTFDLVNTIFNVTDSTYYLFNSDTSVYSYVQMVYDVDTGWINYLAYYYTYNAQNDNDSTILSFWETSNAQWLDQQLTFKVFDANHNLLSTTFAIWDSIAWKNVSQALNDYDANFNLIQQVQLSWNGTSWDTSAKFVFSYDANNNRIEEIDYSGGAPTNKYTTSYNASNYETQNIQQYWNGNTWKNNWRDTLSYDANNNVVIYERRYWHSGSFSLTDTKYAYTYNGMNQVTERIDSNGDGASSYFAAYKYDYTYNVHDNLSYQLQQRYNDATSSFDNAEQTFYYYDSLISGVSSPIADNAFRCKLHPNPTGESLEISLHATNDSNIELQVLDVNGQIISNRWCSLKTGDNSIRSDVSKLPAGVYSVRIFNIQTKAQSVNRFVKE